jgi:hypothetical protein
LRFRRKPRAFSTRTNFSATTDASLDTAGSGDAAGERTDDAGRWSGAAAAATLGLALAVTVDELLSIKGCAIGTGSGWVLS